MVFHFFIDRSLFSCSVVFFFDTFSVIRYVLNFMLNLAVFGSDFSALFYRFPMKLKNLLIFVFLFSFLFGYFLDSTFFPAVCQLAVRVIGLGRHFGSLVLFCFSFLALVLFFLDLCFLDCSGIFCLVTPFPCSFLCAGGSASLF